MARRRILSGGDGPGTAVEVAAAESKGSRDPFPRSPPEKPARLECPFCRERFARADAAPVDKTAVACPKCGSAVSDLNAARPKPPAEERTLPLPHVAFPVPPIPQAPSNPGPAAVHASPAAGPGETVSMTWGKELFSPTRFHTYEVGPFTEQTTVRPGETVAQARERLRASLEKFAEEERVRKRDSYFRAMREMEQAFEQARTAS